MKLVGAVVLLAAVNAGAQTVWRCGADGRDYREAPCPEGRSVDVADARSAGQRAEALQVAAMEKRLAAQLAAERLDREQESAGEGPAGFRTTPPLSGSPGSALQRGPNQLAPTTARPAKERKGRKSALKPAEPGTWRAVGPSSPRAPG